MLSCIRSCMLRLFVEKTYFEGTFNDCRGFVKISNTLIPTLEDINIHTFVFIHVLIHICSMVVECGHVGLVLL